MISTKRIPCCFRASTREDGNDNVNFGERWNGVGLEDDNDNIGGS